MFNPKCRPLLCIQIRNGQRICKNGEIKMITTLENKKGVWDLSKVKTYPFFGV